MESGWASAVSIDLISERLPHLTPDLNSGYTLEGSGKNRVTPDTQRSLTSDVSKQVMECGPSDPERSQRPLG